jgi:peptide/nickel transport system substrate-binding protein
MTRSKEPRARAQHRWLAAGIVAAAVLLACGDDDNGGAATVAPATTVAGGSATTAAGGSATTAAGGSATTAAGGSATTAAGGSATTAAGGSATTSGGGAAAPTGTIKVGMAKGDIDSMDPQRWYYAATWGLANGLCTTLIRYDDKAGADGVKLVAGLADLPTVSADGKEYTFTLKKAKFANGEPITPADIVTTFERLFTPAVDTGTGGYFEAVVVGAQDFADGKATSISGITTTGDSVTFKLSQPDGSFPYKIALPTTCPVGKDAARKPDDGVSILKEYGSGPYVVDSYTPQESMTWVRNPNYDASVLGDRGKAEKVEFTIGVDPAQAALKIKAGDIDVYTGNFPTADITQISNDASLKDRTFTADRPAVLTLFLNNTVAPFDNVKVRQAVNYAVNRSQIQRVWGGPSVGTPTDQILPPSVPAYRDYHAYPDQPDLAKAKQLMQESGVTTPIKTQLRTRNDTAGFMEVASVVQANLKEIGIDVEIVGAPGSVDGAADADPTQKVPMGLVTFSMDFPDGQAFINLLLDPAKPEFGGSYARFNDQSFIPEYERVAALQGEERAKAYMDLDEKIMTEAAPWAPLLTPSRFDVVSSRLSGYTYSQAMDAVNYNTLGVSG